MTDELLSRLADLGGVVVVAVVALVLVGRTLPRAMSRLGAELAGELRETRQELAAETRATRLELTRAIELLPMRTPLRGVPTTIATERTERHVAASE